MDDANRNINKNNKPRSAGTTLPLIPAEVYTDLKGPARGRDGPGQKRGVGEMTETGTYRRSLGLIELVSLGVGGTVGSGIFVVPGIAARISGPYSLIAWVIVALSASCVLLSLSFISYRFTGSSGFYSLFESVFGTRMAVALMALYCISSVFGIATIAAGIGQYITFFSIPSVLLIEILLLTVFCWAQYCRCRSLRHDGEHPYRPQDHSPCDYLASPPAVYPVRELRPVSTPDCNRTACHHHHCLLAVHRF